MKRSVLAGCLTLFLALCFSPLALGEWEYAFSDSAGNSIHLTQKPETVAVLFSSYAEIWTLAGGEVSITVGESVERGFAESGALLVDGGAGKTINHELLLAFQPDLVIGSADLPAHQEVSRLLSQARIPCALFQVDTFEEYLKVLKVFTDITGNEEAYETFGLSVKADAEAVLSRVRERSGESKRILFIRAGSQYSSTKAKRAPDHFACIMLDELGCRNIADDASVLLDGLSLEHILLENPDYIFLSSMGSEEASKAYIADLFSQDGWKNLSAVREGRYAFLPRELFHFKPNARWAEAYAYLAHLLYPELDVYE